jgi:hypothetical protein
VTICGIDPGGNSGGIALINGQLTGHRQVIHLGTMPEDLRYLVELFNAHDIAHVFLEKAQSFPKQGLSSTFNYGRHYGELIGILTALELPFTLVRPQEWTKVIHAGTDGDMSAKERTLQAITRLYPSISLLATPRSKVPHPGLYDALGIAEMGIRKILGQIKP